MRRDGRKTDIFCVSTYQLVDDCTWIGGLHRVMRPELGNLAVHGRTSVRLVKERDMRNTGLAMLLIVFVAAACAPPAAQHSDEIAAMAAEWEGGLNSGDIEAIKALYAENARVLPPNAPMVQGRDAIGATFQGMIDAGLTASLENVEAMVAGDLGYRLGTYVLNAPDGSMVDQGKYVEVWRQIDGAWQMAADIYNSDMPSGAPTGSLLMASHPVDDADVWLAAWQGEDSRFEQFAVNGVAGVRVFQDPGDPNMTGLLIDVTDMEAFQAFLSSEEGEAAKAEDGVQDEGMRILVEVGK